MLLAYSYGIRILGPVAEGVNLARERSESRFSSPHCLRWLQQFCGSLYFQIQDSHSLSFSIPSTVAPNRQIHRAFHDSAAINSRTLSRRRITFTDFPLTKTSAARGRVL